MAAAVQLPKPYRAVDFLGGGAYSAVFRAIDEETGVDYVVKVMPKWKTKQASFHKEADILARLAPACEKYVACFAGRAEDENNYYIITEYQDNSVDLLTLVVSVSFDKITRSDREWFRIIACNLVRGLKAVHDSNVAHRDIKPDNIMVSPATAAVKYIDFGLSCSEGSCEGRPGSMIYVAPEICFGPKVKTLADWQKADMWSLGVTLYAVATGEVISDDLRKRGWPDLRTQPQAYMGEALSGIEPGDYTAPADPFLALLIEPLLRQAQRRRLPLELC